LRKALALDPDNPVVVGRLVEGLCLADRAAEARKVLQAARFRHPRDSRFRKLWNDFQFRQLAGEQYTPPVAEEPVILPFVRRAALGAGRGGGRGAGGARRGPAAWAGRLGGGGGASEWGRGGGAGGVASVGGR